MPPESEKTEKTEETEKSEKVNLWVGAVGGNIVLIVLLVSIF